MRRSLNHIAPILAAIVMMLSCSVPKDLNTEKDIQAPDTFSVANGYEGKQDLVKWGVYFQDTLLVNLIDSAVKYNMDLQMTNQRIYAASANLTASKNAMLPKFNLALGAGVTQFGYYTMDGVGNFDTNKSPNISSDQQIPDPVPDFYLGVTTSWELGVTGRLQNRKRAQYNRFLASQQGRHLMTTRLVAEVARLYYELISLDTELEIIQQNIDLQQKAVEIIVIQKESGRINELAVKQFQAQLLRSRALEAIKLQEIIATENALNFVAGRYPQRIPRRDTLDVNDLPAMLNTGIPSELLKNRPDIQMAEKEFLATWHELKSSRANFYPSILITAQVGMNAFKSSLWFQAPASFAWGLLGGVTAPLLNRPQIMARYRTSYAEKNVAFLDYQKVVLKGVEEVSTEMNRMLNYRTVSQLKSEEVRTLKEAVSISNELFLTGYANYMEVLIARQNRLESELQLTEAKKQQFLSSIFLYKALGGGWQ